MTWGNWITIGVVLVTFGANALVYFLRRDRKLALLEVDLKSLHKQMNGLPSKLAVLCERLEGFCGRLEALNGIH